MAGKMTKADVMVNYLKQMQKLKVKEFSAAEFGAIVDMLGAANYQADASLVAAKDPAELDGVYTRFVADELKMADKDAGMKLIKKVALKMKNEKRKYRAVFYYLLKQAAGK
jgi:hypothetical protein